MSDIGLLDELLDPFTECLDEASARRIADFRISRSVEQRAGELAEKANEGLLESGERAEYEALITAADLITILQLKARRLVSLKAG